MALKIAARGQVAPFMVMDVMRAANQREAAHQAVYHLEVGQPGAGAPQGVLDAAAQALSADRLGYTDALGIAPLRDAIAHYYRDYYGLGIDSGRIVVTTGSSGGFVLAFLSVFDAGDRVAIAAPGYPCYRTILSAFGVEPVELMAGADERFQPTPALLERAQRDGPLDGLIVASPSNPTGTMLPTAEFRALATYCDSHGIRMISDEIYHGITYDRKADSALAFTDDALIINSFSKYFSMTGWRIGWMVVPANLVRTMECLAQNLFISAPTLSQFAALAAFDYRAEFDARVAGYNTNRQLLLDALPKAGFSKLAPADGAFYIYADIGDLTNDSESFCRRLLGETGVALTPGLDFDRERGARFIRISYAESEDVIRGAAEALIGWKR
ncbi:MAG: aminotransferase class I/II-fold pyridoxal phosphate-dependent enzyme [Alphaproteobacteria bacterium]|nr:aminotransferase class I/II-fold pyridoxal phosphate-dependent enzyme [Alphaproteobacteria bacterium]